MNGVKIAVPVAKMSIEDLEYVERITGVSLDEDKPLSEYKKSKARSDGERSMPKAGASIDRSEKPEHDWFNFFLACDIGVGLCERYSQVFNRDNMDESVLPDVDATVLRNLGLREGDILKVLRHLDIKYNRKGKKTSEDGEVGEGGLFSGPGGTLRNNTRKGRPAPAIQTSDTVDPKAFSQQHVEEVSAKPVPDLTPTPTAVAPTPISKTPGGFDDDAWDVKPVKQQPQPQPVPQQPPQQQNIPAPPQPPPPTLTGSMQELSLLSQPLQPTKIEHPPPQPQPLQQPQSLAQQQAPQPTGVTPSFFSGLPQPSIGIQLQPANTSVQQGFQPQQNFGQQQISQQNIARQRPAAPQYSQGQGSLMPPPPPRPLSAPQSAQQSAFGPPPLQPQMTGIPHQPMGFQSIAPPGQSLAEMNQMRMQQQYNQQQMQFSPQQQQMQSQMTGFPGQQNMMAQPTGFGQGGFNQQMQPQQTGFQPSQTFLQGQLSPGPFADARSQQFSPLQNQPTGFQSPFNPQLQFPQQTGVNTFLPPALQPQKTGPMFGQQPIPPMPPMPPMPQQAPAPLIPQKTGPPPPVRFGVTPATKKLAPQPTGKRANLAAASKFDTPIIATGISDISQPPTIPSVSSPHSSSRAFMLLSVLPSLYRMYSL